MVTVISDINGLVCESLSEYLKTSDNLKSQIKQKIGEGRYNQIINDSFHKHIPEAEKQYQQHMTSKGISQPKIKWKHSQIDDATHITASHSKQDHIKHLIVSRHYTAKGYHPESDDHYFQIHYVNMKTGEVTSEKPHDSID